MKRLREKGPLNNEPLYYLKDWHLALESDEEFYIWPDEFKSDWLNEFTINTGRSDYRFVYFGPAGSVTGLHQDVLKSHSWSANICGEKLWHFWRPGKHPIGLEGKGYITDETVLATADYIIEQKDGQTVFVPSGWFHQVKNIKETLSINHNWINRQSIKGSWEYLNEQLDIIEREFDDLKGGMECEGEWLQITQKVLRAQTSLDFDDFCSFLSFIRHRRMRGIVEVGGLIREDVEQIDSLLNTIQPINKAIINKVKSFDQNGLMKP